LGNSQILTTVFPVYAKGTNAFLAVESGHILAGIDYVRGELEWGSCTVAQ